MVVENGTVIVGRCCGIKGLGCPHDNPAILTTNSTTTWKGPGRRVQLQLCEKCGEQFEAEGRENLTGREKVRQLIGTISEEDKKAPAYAGVIWGLETLLERFGENFQLSNVLLVLDRVVFVKEQILEQINLQQALHLFFCGGELAFEFYSQAVMAKLQINNAISIEEAVELVGVVSAVASDFAEKLRAERI